MSIFYILVVVVVYKLKHINKAINVSLNIKKDSGYSFSIKCSKLDVIVLPHCYLEEIIF